jgi:hypothetical protein
MKKYNFELIAERIEHFRTLLDLNKNEFSDKLDQKPNNYKKFITGEIFKTARLLEFDNLGANINWLVSGKGSKYSLNQCGQSLKYKIQTEDDNISKIFTMKSRLKRWIIFEYGDLQQFCLLTKLDYQEFLEKLESEEIFDVTFIDMLEAEGISRNWLYGKTFEPFNKSIKGKERKERYLRLTDYDSEYIKLNRDGQ